jgi:hypothetical protein
VFCAAAGDHGADAQVADLSAVDVVVVAAVCVQHIRSSAGSSALAADRRHGVDQGDELGDVVAVAAGQGGSQRDAVVKGANAATGS